MKSIKLLFCLLFWSPFLYAQEATLLYRGQNADLAAYTHYLQICESCISPQTAYFKQLQKKDDPGLETLSGLSYAEQVDHLKQSALSAPAKELLLSILLKQLRSEPKNEILKQEIFGLFENSGELRQVFDAETLDNQDIAAKVPFISRIEILKTLETIKSNLAMQDSQLFINGQEWSVQNQRSLKNVPQQWVMVGSSFFKIVFWGRWEDFQKQTMRLKPSFIYQCNETLPMNLEVFIHPDCPPSLALKATPVTQIENRSKSLSSSNNSWIWPVSLIALAGAVYLNDKTIAVTVPALNFK